MQIKHCAITLVEITPAACSDSISILPQLFIFRTLLEQAWGQGLKSSHPGVVEQVRKLQFQYGHDGGISSTRFMVLYNVKIN